MTLDTLHEYSNEWTFISFIIILSFISSLSVSLSLLKQSKSIITKGGLWTVDSSYRESLLSALKLNPYHPYHKYFTPPYFPRYIVHTPFKHT